MKAQEHVSSAKYTYIIDDLGRYLVLVTLYPHVLEMDLSFQDTKASSMVNDIHISNLQELGHLFEFLEEMENELHRLASNIK